MQTVIGVILLITFFGFIFYAFKGGNLLLGLFTMAVLWSGLGFLGGVVNWNTINTNIFQGGPEGFGPTAVNIIFGSWFGRVLIETGIARTIIRKAVELGGDKPGLTASLLCIVTTMIFTTAYGAGAVVAIGVIIFPIMLSLGISRPLATGSFAMSVGCGLYLNSALLSQAAGTMIMGNEKYAFAESGWYQFAFVALAIHMIFVLIMVNVGVKRERKSRVWAAGDVTLPGESDNQNTNLFACLTPILPVSLTIAFGFSSIVSIVLSVIWALGWTRYLTKWSKIGAVVEKTFFEGVSDVGLVLGFLLFLQMFIRAAGACKDLIAPIVVPIMPENILLLFIVFGALGFLSLFRGPSTIWGAGAATFAILAGTGLYPLAILFPLFYITSTTITTSICPTQSWNLWAIGYNKVSVKDFLKQVLIYALPLCFILELTAYFMFA